MKRIPALWLLASIGILIGCAPSSIKIFPLDPDRPTAIITDATQRIAFVVPKTDSSGEPFLIVCAEPSPDAAVSVLDKYLTNIKGGNDKISVEAGAQAELNRQIIAMTDRSQRIVMMRDFLYRVCENSLRSDVTQEDTAAFYAMAFEIAKAIVENEDRSKAVDESSPP
ncbi:MAG: hypothetical protein HYS44_01515 [Candidatus Niyogibacteria bacterium]|nr:hypothetical protein [Candidatus Niyogibacteria bacterium]